MRDLFKLTPLLLLLVGCDFKQPTNALFEAVPSAKTGIRFTNTVTNSKELNIFNYRNFYNGGGAAIGDVNNDGLADVFLTSNMGDNKLYLNKGNFQFEDITEKAGVAGKKFWSTGVVMVDINADGWLDIYVCNAGYKQGEKPENELFINPGPLPEHSGEGWDGVFTERAAEYGLNEDGYTTHAAFFDYDLDGDLDCYILNNSFMPVNTLNNSNNRELYAKDWPVKDFLKGGGDKLLRNDGPPLSPQKGGGHTGGFVDVSKEAGIYGSLIGFGLGVTVGDVNGDLWPDIYVSNDFYERDYLYINEGNGTFKEEIESRTEHMSLASMGADMADINNDGLPEIFTTEMLPSDEKRLKTTTSFENYNIYALKEKQGFYHQYMHNNLQLNSPPQPPQGGGSGTIPGTKSEAFLPPLGGEGGAFREIAHYAGVAASDWSWGALMFDADNDGWRDIYVCNGIYKDVIDQDFIDFFADEIIQKMALTGKKEDIETVIDKMPSNPIQNKAFRNRGDLTFEDMGEKWGFGLPTFSNGAAYGDLDNDGDLDLVVNNVNMEALVYRNKSESVQPQNHHLSVLLKGSGQNTFAVGSKVFVHRGKEIQSTELIPSRGFQSSVDYKIVFGLSQLAAVDSVVVVWPDRKKTVLANPPIDQLLTLEHRGANRTASSKIYTFDSKSRFFEEMAAPFQTHREDGFVDFYPEGLSYRMVSREGPKAAVGDVNADGLEDVFLCGAAGQAGQLYLQTKSGFAQSDRATFEADSSFEDTAALFFDADGDKDLDLFVGSGGNQHETASRLMQDRIYVNDGKGHFTLNPFGLSVNGFNTAVAVPLDFDADGDIDLFVGSRSVPGQYAVPPRHFLYENDGTGKLKDVAKTAAPDLKAIGMVTDAMLVNVLGDSNTELVVVGEWMTPQVFSIENKGLKKVKTDLSQYSGWWYAVQADDVDGDGDQDLVLGNRGENFYCAGSLEEPLKIWVWDFDGNGTIEKIMTRTVAGKDVTIALKKELTSQIPSLKKQNLKHADFAQKSIQDLFPADVMQKAMMREGNYFKSVVALNDGGGKFHLVPLPKEVQFSCVKAIHFTDLDGDGKRDLLLGGNDAGFMPQFSKLDASFGHTLLNQGGGNFEWVPNHASGFYLRGDVKQIFELKKGGEPWLVALLNGQKARAFKPAAQNHIQGK
ncbi:MAG: VCBS repeat-containing protein [Saprospiraceae bacterium]